MTTMDIIRDFSRSCPCGVCHETTVKDVVIESGAVHKVGEILERNNFPENLYLVADKNTMGAADGILEALSDFHITSWILDNQRLATIEQVEYIQSQIHGRDISVLSVGTGSLNDICRVAAARENKLFCIFATAPSMDGFASYSAPIVDNGFKLSLPAKSPEVIIADTRILADSPAYLKSAGFGDMVAKYVGIADWKISALLTGEYYCEKVAKLTLDAVNELMELADKVTVNDEKTAGMIFESLLKTGLGMSFVKNSRPASGCEHIIAHLMECLELFENKLPNVHGEDIGVCTLRMLQYYSELASHEKIKVHKEITDWDKVYSVFGPLAGDVRKLNTPDTCISGIAPAFLEEKWPEIRAIIKDLPDYETCLEAMKKANCKITVEDIGKKEEFFLKCVKYSPYMRRRLTLLRLSDMFEVV